MPEEVLEAANVLEYPFSRSSGPVIGAFMTALRDEAKILGAKTAKGKVLVPPAEYDADGEPIEELVEVGPGGSVTSWAWVRNPHPKHPLQRPFAWALVKLDGADSSMVHVVDAGSLDRMETGMRVVPRFRQERRGHIADIECFVPEGDPLPPIEVPDRSAAAVVEPVTKVDTPIEMTYRYTAGRAASKFLRGIMERRILGQRCPSCGKVYVPPRGSCAKCGVATEEEVELPAKGTVTTFCVVNVPFYGQKIEIPYVTATILLDGADIGLFHLIQECKAEDVHMGMRVEGVWADELVPGLESIRYFRPTGEPDADYETYKEHV